MLKLLAITCLLLPLLNALPAPTKEESPWILLTQRTVTYKNILEYHQQHGPPRTGKNFQIQFPSKFFRAKKLDLKCAKSPHLPNKTYQFSADGMIYNCTAGKPGNFQI
jgi:hypothetical protein